MCRVLVVALTGLLVVGISFSAFAEEKGMMGCDMMKSGMMGKQTMGDSGMAAHGGMMGMCPMMNQPMGPMMNHAMMSKSLVATADGGVVVLVGNKLLKYDKDLVLQKQAEIEMDMAGMQKMMPMMQGCPMAQMGGGMGCCGMMERCGQMGSRGQMQRCSMEHRDMKKECKRYESPRKHALEHRR